MLSWKIGDVSITRVLELVLPVAYYEKYPFMREARPAALRKIPWLYPNFVGDDGELLISIHALLVQTADFSLLVDTCVGNDKERGVKNWNMRTGPFLEDLTAAGFPPESIDRVMCTHLHVDHVGWNTRFVDGRWRPTFPNTTCKPPVRRTNWAVTARLGRTDAGPRGRICGLRGRRCGKAAGKPRRPSANGRWRRIRRTGTRRP